MGVNLSDDGKSPPYGPCKLAGGGRRLSGCHLVHHWPGGEGEK
jgi:hypothetical protein